jgi:hypothetical protein
LDGDVPGQPAQPGDFASQDEHQPHAHQHHTDDNENLPRLSQNPSLRT